MKAAAQQRCCCHTFLRRRRSNWAHESPLSAWFTGHLARLMTTSKRVQDRSRYKRVHDLEAVTEKCKVAHKVLFLMEILRREPEMVIPVRSLAKFRRQINLPKPNRVSDFIRKSPKLFELFRDRNGLMWCGMTERAEELVREEEALLRDNEDNAAEIVTRFLMMSVDNRLPLDKIAHFRRDFGLAADFRTDWVNKYPKLFRVSKNFNDGVRYLELVEWNPRWAVTELERKKGVDGGVGIGGDDRPGTLSLPFPLKFPADYSKKVYRDRVRIGEFQRRPYLSPYADARGIWAGSLEFDKRAVAVMHELLSFTLEKRLATTDHLTHFRRELVMPQKLMRLLLKHCGIFYVSERGKRFSVFLTEAYEGRELAEKCPLVLWKGRVLDLVGYRGKKTDFECFSDMTDMDDEDQGSGESGSEDERLGLGVESDEESEMEIEEVCNEYQEQH